MASTFGPEMLIQLLRNIFKKKMYLKADMTKVAVHFSLKNCSFIMCVHNFLLFFIIFYYLKKKKRHKHKANKRTILDHRSLQKHGDEGIISVFHSKC